MAESPFDIELADMLYALREQIDRAQQRAAGQNIGFNIQEIELQVAVSRAKAEKGEAKIGFNIFNAAIGSQTTNTREKTIRLKLSAHQFDRISGNHIPIPLADQDPGNNRTTNRVAEKGGLVDAT